MVMLRTVGWWCKTAVDSVLHPETCHLQDAASTYSPGRVCITSLRPSSHHRLNGVVSISRARSITASVALQA